MGLQDGRRPDLHVLSSLGRAVAVAAGVAFADQLSKVWATGRLSPGPCTPESCFDIFWTLRFHLHFNPGASFSTGPGLGRLFGAIAIVMTVVIFRMAAQATDLRSPLLLGAIAGGAVGNLIDRIVRAEDGILSGHVVDFIDFQWWPIFNIADAGIVVGVVSLILMQLFLPDDKEVVPSDG
ncbi:MAG: signal peptidase II [Acidimicrobiales bacterium]|jgi:signal peptidase II